MALCVAPAESNKFPNLFSISTHPSKHSGQRPSLFSTLFLIASLLGKLIAPTSKLYPNRNLGCFSHTYCQQICHPFLPQRYTNWLTGPYICCSTFFLRQLEWSLSNRSSLSSDALEAQPVSNGLKGSLFCSIPLGCTSCLPLSFRPTGLFSAFGCLPQVPSLQRAAFSPSCLHSQDTVFNESYSCSL